MPGNRAFRMVTLAGLSSRRDAAGSGLVVGLDLDRGRKDLLATPLAGPKQGALARVKVAQALDPRPAVVRERPAAPHAVIRGASFGKPWDAAATRPWRVAGLAKPRVLR